MASKRSPKPVGKGTEYIVSVFCDGADQAYWVETYVRENLGMASTARYTAPDYYDRGVPGVSGRTAAWAILASLTALALLVDLFVLLWR